MKNILVPTDFSTCADLAADAATLLAKRFGATVHFVTCLSLPYRWKEMTEKQQKKYAYAQDDIRQAERLLEEKRKKYEGVSMVTIWDDSDLLKNIGDYVRQQQIDLIVMGSHGTSGKSELFIGPITQKVVRTVHCPVLIVKDPLENVDFQRVIFASSFQADELPAFEQFLNLLQPFSPEVHLVYIRASAFQESNKTIRAAMKTLKDRCKPLVCKAHIFKYFSVSGGIQAFSNKIGADLICVSNHHRHPLKRMLDGSNVEMLVNHADPPVLTIDFEENINPHH